VQTGVKLPKLKKEDIDELSISPPEKPAVTLKKAEKGWTLTSPLTAAADSAAVETALSKLAELEVVGLAATQADNHERLDVTDKKAVHVIAKQGGKPVLDVLLGAYRTGNTMVREPSSDNVAVVKGSIKYAFEKEIKDWRERLVVDVTSEQVKAVTFDNAKGSFHFVKEDNVWKQAPGDKPIAGFESGKIVSLVGTATTMRANDFAAADVTEDAAGVGAKPVGLVTLTTGGDAGEQQVVLHVGQKHGDGYYLKREGKDVIFVVSPFAGERMLSGPDKFVKDEPKPADPKAGAKADATQAKKPIVVEPTIKH
ncbi:MAG: DUF4340 domain-containing protein, partial [Polyangiales bacterium]